MVVSRKRIIEVVTETTSIVLYIMILSKFGQLMYEIFSSNYSLDFFLRASIGVTSAFVLMILLRDPYARFSEIPNKFSIPLLIGLYVLQDVIELKLKGIL